MWMDRQVLLHATLDSALAGGAIDGGAAKDGRSKSRDGSGGQASGRGLTTSSPRHFKRCESSPSNGPSTRPLREALTRMTGALASMRAMQQAQHQGQGPITPMTPTVTQGSEPFQELPVTQEAVLREAMRQAEATAVGQSPQGASTPQERLRYHTREELREGLGETTDLFLTEERENAAERRTPNSYARRTPKAERDPREMEETSTMEKRRMIAELERKRSLDHPTNSISAHCAVRNARYRRGKANSVKR